MKEIKPYATLAPLKKALDNGGRFYNFFDDAGDEVVSRAELAKAAGVFTAGIKAHLFLEMARQDLAPDDRENVLSLLAPDLRKEFLKRKPAALLPSLVDQEGKAGQPIVTTGYARRLEDRNSFKGFVMVPIMAGRVITMVLVPIVDRFQVLEVFDGPAMKGASAIVAIPKRTKLELGDRLQFGGVMRHVKFKGRESSSHALYVEAIFFARRPE